jgi:hypothetical protein
MTDTLRSEIARLTVGSGGPLEAVESWLLSMAEARRTVLRFGFVGGPAEPLHSAVHIEYCATPQSACAGAWDRAGPASVGGIQVALVVPTGVGAAIGGFIGDAGPVARAFESAADHVLLHPNVVNGADLYGATERSCYVDGYTLDEFFAGRVRLTPPAPRKVGLILDKLDSTQTHLILNAANATCAVWGIEIVGYSVCREQTRGVVRKSAFNHFLGELLNPDVLFTAADRLIAAGAEVIAALTAIEGIPHVCWVEHYRGSAPNPVGAMEALISRAITWKTGLPCAHAPAYIEGMASADEVVDPRAAAEVVSRTGLPCVLSGLARASVAVSSGGFHVSGLTAIVVPFACAGGMPALASRRFAVPLIAVKANRCSVGVAADKLDLKNLVVVESYAEAIAYVVARRAGVSWSAIQGPVAKLQQV